MKKNIRSICSLLTVAFLMLHANSAVAAQDFADFDMTDFIPAKGKNYESYTIGEFLQAYTAKRWVPAFSMNKYETTYNLWYSVKIQAEKSGYVFMNPGQEGSSGKIGDEPTENRFHPVTRISWYDAIVWCNALSELNGKTPCYTYKNQVLRDSTDTATLDLCTCNWQADGYRLPREEEWEFCARKTKNGMQRGDEVSGQLNSEMPAENFAWNDKNATGTRTVGTAGTPFMPEAQPMPGTGNANASGLFDMSGNVLELCWDWLDNYKETVPEKYYAGPQYGSQRVARGGSWNPYSAFVLCADRYAYDPNEVWNFIGFRICRTIQMSQ